MLTSLENYVTILTGGEFCDNLKIDIHNNRDVV